MNACYLWVCVARGACKFQTASLVVLLFLHLTRFWLFQHEPVYCYKFECANWLQVLITNRMHSLNAMDLSCGVCLTRDRMDHLNVCQTSSVTAQWQLIGCSERCNKFVLPNFLGDAFTKNLGGYFQPMECCIECFNLTTLCIKLWDQWLNKKASQDASHKKEK